MGRYKKLLSNTFLMIIGQFSSKLLGFLLVPFYTSILSTEEYGTYDLLITTVSLLTPFLTLVVSEAVMRFCLDKDYDDSHILTIGATFVFLGTAVLLLGFPIIRKIDFLSEYSWWLILFFALMNFESILMQYLKGVEKIKTYTICGILSTLCSLSLNILFLAVFKLGVFGYMLAGCCSLAIVITVICLTQKIWNNIVNPFKIPKSIYKDIVKYTFPMIPNSISWWISNSSDKYMIKYMVSVSAVGMYSVAYKIPSILTIFVTIFISAFQISSVENFGSKKSIEFFSNIYKVFASFGIIVSSVLIFASNFIAKILFKNDFFEAWKISGILILAFAFNSLAAYLGTIYTASKKTKFLFYSTTIAALLNIALNLVLIKFIGTYGAAIATLASYICVWLLRLINSRKILPIKISIVSNLISYLLLILEIVLVVYDDCIFSIKAVVVMLAIITVNAVVLIKSDIFKQILSKFKRSI